MITSYKSIDIIGGGIIGTALATELLREIRKHGLNTEVHLFEKNGQLGIENTEKSFEGVRTYWFTPEEIRFYLTSIHALKDLKGYFSDIRTDARLTSSYRQVGYHYFLSAGDMEKAVALKPMFDELGIPLEFYTKDEALRFDWIRNNLDLDADILDEDDWVYSQFDLDRWMSADFDFPKLMEKSTVRQYQIDGYVRVPVAGFIAAGDVVASCRAVFEALGGHIHLNTTVTGLDSQNGTLTQIRFKEGSSNEKVKSTDFAINTAGIWADPINELALGERLGITPHRRYPLIVQPPKGYNTDHGMVLMKNRVIRPDGDKIWLYFTPQVEKPGIETRVPDDRTYDEYFFRYIFPVFCSPERPFIRHAETLGLRGSVDARGWLGHYADTPDERPFIGLPRPGKLSNYAVSTGYSGHGVQAAIAAGLGLTHRILELDGEPSAAIPPVYTADRDLSGVRPDRSRL